MKFISTVIVIFFGFVTQAQAARGIVVKKPGGGSASSAGRVMTYDGSSTEVFVYAPETLRNTETRLPRESDLVSFEPRGATASALAVLPPDGFARYAIEGTPKTPTIFSESSRGLLEIKGRSIPENSIEFYKPFIESLETYIQKPVPVTIVNLKFSAISEGTHAELSLLLKKLESIHKGGTSKVAINWYYEEDDEDMLEAGEDYQAIINVPFKMIQVSE